MYTLLFIGWPEIIIILLIVVMFFGSKRIPEIARGLAKGMKEVKNVTNEIKREINTSSGGLDQIATDLKSGVKQATEAVKDIEGSVSRTMRKTFNPSKEDPQAPVKDNSKTDSAANEVKSSNATEGATENKGQAVKDTEETSNKTAK